MSGMKIAAALTWIFIIYTIYTGNKRGKAKLAKMSEKQRSAYRARIKNSQKQFFYYLTLPITLPIYFLFNLLTMKPTYSLSDTGVENEAKAIMNKVLSEFQHTLIRIEEKRRKEGMVYKYHVTIGNIDWIVKAYAVYESYYLIIDIWPGDESEVLDVLATGDLRQKYRMRSMAKMRLRPWVSGEKIPA